MAYKFYNINVGLMGHVDSGKTSLAKALSTKGSTAAFDKHPQSEERGMTLDLGFSSFTLPIPENLFLKEKYESLQFTLVDCPGHASFIRTIIGGANIIDLMILVIDVNKGIQTQTAECIVIGQLTTQHCVVVLNKIDTIEEKLREKKLARVERGIRKGLSSTVFKNAPMIPISANSASGESIGIDLVHQALLRLVPQLPKVLHLQQNPDWISDKPFQFAIDHCFAVKGQGTVITGTVLEGNVKINQTIEFPEFKQTKKVKSMQMFRTPVSSATKGDRVGICITQLDPKLIERGVAGDIGAYIQTKGVIIAAERVNFFKGRIATKSKFHISIGHSTVMGVAHIFSIPSNSEHQILQSQNDSVSTEDFDLNREYIYQDELFPQSEDHPEGHQFMLLIFEKSVFCTPNSLLIGSKLDTDVNANLCRLAFNGRVLMTIDPSPESLKKLLVYKIRERKGTIDRVVDEYNVIGKDMFKKETNISVFVGLQVYRTTNNAVGRIEGSFGKSGKFKVYFPAGGQQGTDGELVLCFKKFIFDRSVKTITQSKTRK